MLPEKGSRLWSLRRAASEARPAPLSASTTIPASLVEGIGGSELADQMKAHAERFDVEILPAQTVTQIQTDGDHKSIFTESGDEYCAAAVLLAPGTRYRRLGVPG